MKKLILLVSLFFVAVLSACSKTQEKSNAQEKKGAMSFFMVSMAEGLDIAKKNPDAIIIDVRRDNEYKSGHIPGAVLFTMENISAKTAERILPDKDKLVLIYCRSGRRSKIAAQNLVDLGYTNIVEFGGIIDYHGELEY